MQLFEQGADGNVTWTNKAITVGASVVTQAMGNARHIVLYNSGSTNIYFTLDGTTPTSSNFLLAATASISMDGLPATANLKLLSSAAGGSVSVLGW
jgi:hypothetical protein